jgi:hypothetical protein
MQTTRKANPGQFQKGHDPRRHTFTPQECSDGFQAALESIIRRYGIHCTDRSGRHMVCSFGKHLTRKGRMKPRA